jgi:hypothetical protein
VGREAELDILHTALSQSQRSVPQLVFVAGDPGMGKSTLVRQFLFQVSSTTPLWMCSGLCIEHFGSGEAYLPLLEALGRLGREPGSESLVVTLRRMAPMWLAHLPQLVEPDELEGLQRQVQGMRTERMLREFAEALAVITRETVVVPVLEDLQWSDTATVETLGYLARRPEPLRLLVLGTYRPAEACFQQALDLARQQGSSFLELRAAMSLSRLWLAQDQPDAVQALLVELYGWFTEGRETVDLLTAKALLDRCHHAR